MGKKKEFCSKNNCNDCNEIFWIKSAQRYCYDEKYSIPRITRQMRYKKNNVTNIIATGVIEHITHNSNDNNCEGESESYSWEKNMNSLYLKRVDYKRYLIKEVCLELNIDYKLFMNKILEISDEMEKNENAINSNDWTSFN